MADGYFPTLVSKDKDPNAVADPIWVQLTDGTTALSVTGTSLDVNLTNSSVPVTGTFWQTTQPVSGTFWQTTQPVSIATTVNVDIQDSWAGLTGAGTEAGVLRVTIANDSTGVLTVDDGGSSLTVDGTVGITGTVAVSASDLDIRNLNLTDDAVKISANATANSVSNPIYVALGSGPITGEVHSYNDASTSTTTDHDYPVVTAMLVKGIECASSGGAKFELLTGPLAGLVAKWTGLIPKQGGTISVKFDPPIEVPVTSTGTVRVIRTNRESQAQSLYTTIIGIDA